MMAAKNCFGTLKLDNFLDRNILYLLLFSNFNQTSVVKILQLMLCDFLLWHWFGIVAILGSWRCCRRCSMASEAWILIWLCWRWSAPAYMGSSDSISEQACPICYCSSKWGIYCKYSLSLSLSLTHTHTHTWMWANCYWWSMLLHSSLLNNFGLQGQSMY